MEDRVTLEMIQSVSQKYEQGRLTVSDCEHFLNEIPRFTQKHMLEDTRRFLDDMGAPDQQMKIIHVAGTNGKGSVCAYMDSILQNSGYTTGMFTSPHLVSITERFRINGCVIDEALFLSSFMQVLSRISGSAQPDYFPTFFEYLFFMAMVLYRDHPVDYLILETGLGGRLDATNSIRKPKVCVITEIGMDHMQYLGNTIEAIAGEKAGIIKKGIPVVFCDRRSESSSVILKKAGEMGADAYRVSGNMLTDVQVRSLADGNKCIDFSYESRYDKYVGLTVPTPAIYQSENAALAISTAEVLARQGAEISQQNIRKGLATAHWEGRMERVLPWFYVDGAHNADGMEAFLDSVRNIDCTGHRTLLFGVVGDKQYSQMIERILESRLFETIAVAALYTERSVSEEELERTFLAQTTAQKIQQRIHFFADVKSAYAWISGNRQQGDLVFAAGSLYLAGQLLAERHR